MAHNNQLYYPNENNFDAEESSSAFKKRRSDIFSSSSSHHQPLNRTDIINHASILIDKLGKERDQQKAQLMGIDKNSTITTGRGSTEIGAVGTTSVAVIASPPTVINTAPMPAEDGGTAARTTAAMGISPAPLFAVGQPQVRRTMRPP